MKKRSTNIIRNNLNSNSRRRQLLKRVHQKVALRRQQYQIMEVNKDCPQPC